MCFLGVLRENSILKQMACMGAFATFFIKYPAPLATTAAHHVSFVKLQLCL